jgi:hypothetical protein
MGKETAVLIGGPDKHVEKQIPPLRHGMTMGK